jgi:PTH2 family peptidyl-tRNA hydrolase
MKVKNPYDNPARVKARKEQEDPWVMYIIVRKSLDMSAGKTAAQAGHVVGILYEEYIRIQWLLDGCIDDITGYVSDPKDLKEKDLALLIKLTDFEDWKKNSFRKIVLKANDNKWEKLKEELECFIVRDAGLTQIEPGSETCIGIWPIKKSKRPKIIKALQLL